MSIQPEDARTQAIETLANRKFHHLFTLPSTPTHGPLKVTYSIAGIEKGDVPTILFCAGMFGGRWLALYTDYLATKGGVRILYFDRPGIGGSTPVPLKERIPIFLETIPLLLQHLNIKHIALASHSAGTIFALNLLALKPELLDPSNPRVTFFSPWVHPTHSGLTSLHLLSLLPNAAFGNYSKLVSFYMKSVAPSAAFNASQGLLRAIKSPFQKKSTAEEDEEEEEEFNAKCLESHGVPAIVLSAICGQQQKYLFAEDMSGGNDETRLVLRVTKNAHWGPAEDLREYVKALSERWKGKEGREKLKVCIVFPEEDALVGEKGMRYFEDCWKDGDGEGRAIEVEVRRMEETDHDSVIADEFSGAMREMIERLKS